MSKFDKIKELLELKKKHEKGINEVNKILTESSESLNIGESETINLSVCDTGHVTINDIVLDQSECITLVAQLKKWGVVGEDEKVIPIPGMKDISGGALYDDCLKCGGVLKMTWIEGEDKPDMCKQCEDSL